MFGINPKLSSNEARERLVGEVNDAIRSFEQLRQGELDEFIDCVGLPDDGSGSREIVNPDTVDMHEEDFRRKWRWLCPDLINSDKQKIDG